MPENTTIKRLCQDISVCVQTQIPQFACHQQMSTVNSMKTKSSIVVNGRNHQSMLVVFFFNFQNNPKKTNYALLGKLNSCIFFLIM